MKLRLIILLALAVPLLVEAGESPGSNADFKSNYPWAFRAMSGLITSLKQTR